LLPLGHRLLIINHWSQTGDCKLSYNDPRIDDAKWDEIVFYQFFVISKNCRETSLSFVIAYIKLIQYALLLSRKQLSKNDKFFIP
jgi:hypothetical protein